MAYGSRRAAEIHADARPARGEGACEGRRGRRTVWRRADGAFASAGKAKSGSAPRAAEKRVPYARSAHEGTKEVRTERGTASLPVQQAVGLPRFLGVAFWGPLTPSTSFGFEPRGDTGLGCGWSRSP